MPSNTSKPISPADRPPALPRRTRRLLLPAAALGLLAAGAAGYGMERHLYHRPGAFAGGIVAIAPASPLAGIAGRLHAEGVVERPLLFRLSVMLRGLGRRLQAGEFRIPAGASMRQAAEILAYGHPVEHPVTVPEGAGSRQIVAWLRANPLLSGEIAAVPPEGSLLPETYHVQRGSGREALLARMAADMRDTLARLWPRRAAGLPLQSPQEAVILASIVEKETGLERERGKVAAVFLNRLRKGMRLQADPTVIYGLTGGATPLGRPLSRSDLHDKANPYNSYRHAGLPPTPICNPGLASLQAVLNPADGDWLYFVADGSGGHAFAASFAEHRRNVAAWRSRPQ